ncbi:transcriptional regulator XRE family [Candidatus Termititenax aidoneus]|uniref:Transcriptional regulator XRE family n=1 Tax=Termititenax aidoneus TaxID=2218524 RepID=A0A388TCA3_TERA1|nr:transcriptional regulator XRE family [Candidatus Termititenax aidoneus]
MNTRLSVIVGCNIKRHRKKLCLSQEKLAERAGLHRTYIGGVERGERNITLDSLQVIAIALNIAPTKLIMETNNV